MSQSGKLRALLRAVSLNALLGVCSLMLLALLLEFVVFRWVLIAPDKPTVEFVDGVVKYQPDQRGVYRIKNEIESRYAINRNGWNSGHPHYQVGKHPGKYRIAVIGDSYVEALQVDFNQSLAERLERKLGDERFEVYRFGISGAPLSHYLHVLRREVVRYAPDLVIVVLVHNDFHESYAFKPGVYTSSFLKLQIRDGTVVDEVPPQPYRPPWYSWIRDTATWRYLAYRQQLRFQALRDFILGKKTAAEHYQANIDASALEQQRANNRLATHYTFQGLKTVCQEHGARLLIVMDGDRHSIYENRQRGAKPLALNHIARTAAGYHGIPFLDLHGVFERDYATRQKRFNFVNDGHWNAYGHGVLADAIYAEIKAVFNL